MSLDREVRAFLAAADLGTSLTGRTAQERRARILELSDSLFAAFGEPAGEVHAVTECPIAVSGGEIRLRVYRPSADTGAPVHVFFHGGGFWLGSIDEKVVDATCRERCLGAGCVVVSVAYRLAPEHPFPTAVEDCYRALVWSRDHAEDIGGDPGNLSVGGVSAGANLAAAVAIAARDRRGPQVAFQLLEVPPLDLTLELARGVEVGDEYGMTVADMEECVDHYIMSEPDTRHPLASPVLLDDLAGLPRARIMTAELDPLHRDGEVYARRLREAGVPVSYTRYPGAVHGSILLTGTWEPARQWREDVIDHLRYAHGQDARRMVDDQRYTAAASSTRD